jgi:hypothetical protein
MVESPEVRASRGGLVAGGVGGAALLGLMVFRSAAAHLDIWRQLKLAGMPFWPKGALEPGFALGPVLLGVACHFAIAAIWGLAFAVLFDGLSRRGTVLAGAVLGFAAWLTMFHAVLPLFGLGHLAHLMPFGLVAYEHVVFGLAIGVGYLPFQRSASVSERAPFPAGGGE